MAEKAIFIGAGNVAWHLAHAIDKAGIQVDQIITQHTETAKALAQKFGAYFGTEPVAGSKADWIFICVSDGQIEIAAEQLQHIGGIMVHTSGSIDMEVLNGKSTNYGVFYPLQTFNKNREVDFLKVPLLLEASDVITENKLKDLAENLSNKVMFANSEQRKIMHLAAVVVNNFTNHLFAQAELIAQQSGLPISILHPLMQETVNKAMALGAQNAQTGPAKRGDEAVIQTHIDWLYANLPDLATEYEVISQSIIKSYRSTE
jgi:predicted short-subunit dehydrogenase-like oxidoreductase (DUF2520 family)